MNDLELNLSKVLECKCDGVAGLPVYDLPLVNTNIPQLESVLGYNGLKEATLNFTFHAQIFDSNNCLTVTWPLLLYEKPALQF